MNAREKILNAIRQNKPDKAGDLEIQILPVNSGTELIEEFCRMLEGIGGRVIRTNDIEQIRLDLAQSVANGLRVVNTIPEIGDTNEIYFSETPESLSNIENSYLSSYLGISENGAVWFAEKDLHNRLLPFITQHLTVLLYEKDLVGNMHEAYSKISGTDAGFHVFIAGPSKTADIEQSLVIGAHGPRSLLVYLIR